MEQNNICIVSKDFPKVVIPLINNAKHSIDIVVFDWRFYKNDPSNPVSTFNHSIGHACTRGVNVRAYIKNDGVIDILKQLGVNAKKHENSRILHTKMIIIDNSIVVLGSHNYTQHAFSTNYEVSTQFTVDPVKNDFVDYFNNIFGV